MRCFLKKGVVRERLVSRGESGAQPDPFKHRSKDTRGCVCVCANLWLYFINLLLVINAPPPLFPASACYSNYACAKGTFIPLSSSSSSSFLSSLTLLKEERCRRWKRRRRWGWWCNCRPECHFKLGKKRKKEKKNKKKKQSNNNNNNNYSNSDRHYAFFFFL